MSRISDLAGFSTALSTTQDLSVGIITATTFSGDGSGLTGVASTDNIQTATDAKFLANVSIAGTLTYLDVTNVDSIGVITGRNGLDITGVGTFSSDIKLGPTAEITTSGTDVLSINAASNHVRLNNYSIFYPSGNVVLNNGGQGTTQIKNQVYVLSGITSFKNDVIVENDAEIGRNLNVTGVVTATSFKGDGSQLSGIDASSLTDSGGTTRVQANTSGVVVTGVLTATQFSGDGSGLTFAPKIIAFDPNGLSTGVAIDKTITITFDQNISFSGNGTVSLRSGSAGGSVIEDFDITNGTPDTGLSISGTQLIINPNSNFANGTVVYVVLPSSGIVNSAGTAYAGSNNYYFQTALIGFTAQGGDHVYTLANGSSPTGYYKYHIFTSSGILTTTQASQTAEDFAFMLIAGGGGGGTYASPSGGAGGGGGAGGLISHTGPTLSLATGTYTVTIGAGGQRTHPSAYNWQPGDDSYITPPTAPTTYVTRAFGGGSGGGSPPTNTGSGNPGGSGGGGATRHPNPNVSGGTGTPGQGNNGAPAFTINPIVPQENGVSGGGGGGAGGAAEPASQPTRFYGPTSEHVFGGAGGTGTPNPAFPSVVLAGYTSIPTDSLSAIGPTGLYAGGGGGAGYPGAFSWGGAGGSGGGGNGNGAYSTLPTPAQNQIPGPIVTQKYTNVPASPTLRPGRAYTGGGGGGAAGPSAGDGGSGVMMIRYATPEPA